MSDIKCGCGNTFNGMIGKEDSCPECIRACIKPMKFGACPYCNMENYNKSLSEYIDEYEIPYIVINCECDGCEKSWTEYYSQDEIKFEDGDENEHIYTNQFGEGEKKTLLRAIDILVHREEDTEDYTNIIKKLNGELEKTE